MILPSSALTSTQLEASPTTPTMTEKSKIRVGLIVLKVGKLKYLITWSSLSEVVQADMDKHPSSRAAPVEIFEALAETFSNGSHCFAMLLAENTRN